MIKTLNFVKKRKMEFFITCNGIPVHVSDSKTGQKVIILLHGYLETLYIWEELSSLLSKEFRVVSLDLPGHGLSGTFQVNTMDACAGIVVGVMDHLGIEKAYVMGHSMGGYVASKTVTTYPGRFLGLAMMNSVPFADTPEKKENRDREISLIKQNKLHQIVRLSITNMFSPLNKSRLEEKIMEISEIAEVHDPEGIAASIEGMKQREDFSSLLPALPLPILFFFGSHDCFIPAEVADRVKEVVPNALYVQLENSGHNGFLEEPHKCFDTLVNFSNL